MLHKLCREGDGNPRNAGKKAEEENNDHTRTNLGADGLQRLFKASDHLCLRIGQAVFGRDGGAPCRPASAYRWAYIAAVSDEVLQPEVAAKRALDELEDPGFEHAERVDRVIRMGTPFVEIVRYAKEKEIDLIVMGTHGRTGVVHALIGSVAEKVVRKAPCPVLTVRPEGHQFVLP